MERLAQLGKCTVVIAIIYVALDAVVVFLFNQLQALWLPDITKYSSLIYLPFALRVFATSLLGAEAIPGLFLGMLVSSMFLWGVSDPSLLLLTSAIGSLSTWIVFCALVPLGVNAFYLKGRVEAPPLNIYLLAGLMTAMVDAFLMVAVLEGGKLINNVTMYFASLVLGALAGLLVVWFVAHLLLPLINRLFAR